MGQRNRYAPSCLRNSKSVRGEGCLVGVAPWRCRRRKSLLACNGASVAFDSSTILNLLGAPPSSERIADWNQHLDECGFHGPNGQPLAGLGLHRVLPGGDRMRPCAPDGNVRDQVLNVHRTVGVRSHASRISSEITALSLGNASVPRQSWRGRSMRSATLLDRDRRKGGRGRVPLERHRGG